MPLPVRKPVGKLRTDAPAAPDVFGTIGKPEPMNPLARRGVRQLTEERQPVRALHAYRTTDPTGLWDDPYLTDVQKEAASRDYQEEAEKETKAEEAHAAGLATIDEAIAGLLDDPILSQALDTLAMHAQPDYYAVGPETRTAMEAQLASGINRAQQQAMSNLVASGWGESGIAASIDPLYAAIGARGLGDISAQLATANTLAREQALQSIADLGLQRGREVADLQRIRALAEMDPVFMSTDPFLFASMSTGAEEMAHQREYEQQVLDIFEESMQPNIRDLFLAGLGALWPGGFDIASLLGL